MKSRLVALALSAGLLQSQPVVAPTPVDHSANEQTVGGYTVAQSFETGYRFRSVGGNLDRYRSDVNFGNGIRLLGSSLTLHSREGHGRWFDELTLTTQGLGNDPYQNAILRLRHNRFYRYDLNWRINDYVNPGVRPDTGIDHAMNTRRQWQDHDITLLPSSALQFITGMSRNTQSGSGISSIQLFNAAGDAFPLFTNIRRTQTEYRAGLQVGLSGFRFLFLHGWQRYSEDSPASVSTPQPGLSPNDGLSLQSFGRADIYTGNSPFWRGNLSFEPNRWVSISARIDYAAGRRTFLTDESAFATDRFGNNRNRQVLVAGNGTRPVTSGAFTLSIFPADRVTITNQTAFHQIQMNGDSRYAEFNNATAGLNLVNFQYLGIRTAINSTTVNVQAARTFGIFGGFDFSDRRIRSIVGQTFAAGSDRTAAEQTNQLKAGTLGVRWKPWSPVTVVLDGELGRANRPFLPVADRNYSAAGARIQYHAGSLTLTAATRQNYNDNSSAAPIFTSFSARNRNTSFSGTWAPSERFSLDAGYSKLHVHTLGGINYFAGGQLVPGTSRYVSNIHSSHAFARLAPHAKVEFFIGFTRIQDTGDGANRSTIALPATAQPVDIAQAAFAFWQVFPLSFTSPQARLSLRLHPKLAWNLGYQHYGYDERFLSGYNYRAHTGYTSLLWSF